MSRMLDHNSQPWKWSPCSRQYLTEFFDDGNGMCLINRPEKDLLREHLISPVIKEAKIYTSSDSSLHLGELFDVNYQCQLIFGKKSKICPYMPPCKRLWCTIGNTGRCRTQHMPWADGTSCGRFKWCQRGQCVIISSNNNKVVDGSWGPWSSFTPCSRSCGGGIQKSVRDCDHPESVLNYVSASYLFISFHLNFFKYSLLNFHRLFLSASNFRLNNSSHFLHVFNFKRILALKYLNLVLFQWALENLRVIRFLVRLTIESFTS